MKTKKMHHAVLLIACLLLLPLSATAAVRYDFTAFSSFDLNFDDEEVDTYSGRFVLDVPDFIVPGTYPNPTILAPDSLLSCSVQNRGSATGRPCGNQQFVNFPGTLADVIGFGVDPEGSVAYYYFPLGAFSAFGMFDSILLGDSQRALLVVSGSPDQGTTVPEPGTLALLGVAVAGLGLARRRTQ